MQAGDKLQPPPPRAQFQAELHIRSPRSLGPGVGPKSIYSHLVIPPAQRQGGHPGQVALNIPLRVFVAIQVALLPRVAREPAFARAVNVGGVCGVVRMVGGCGDAG